jgi:glycyl-tRNA synthetase
MPDRLNFQEIIQQLTDYWKQRGCLVWHPHNVQVGAGTMNPATVLRVLGPEPWNVVYLEPSIRPDDGRFGDNPYRMQQHYQLQVILKPDPGNPQELYLESLEAVGIDPREHDIRFVEDNWRQPALGAWGLGWEVWLDGQEITQFTYFQQAGGINLDPVSVEITYGLDRIALALQGVDSVWEIDFGAGTIYGDLLLQQEIEHCRYYFDEADVTALKKVYDIYENEARRSLEAGLVAPAHDFNLKCSFLFNVMDTRGAIGVTERANYFRRMRNVARGIAEGYLEQRQQLEYPFLENERWQQVETDEQAAKPPQVAVSDKPQTFVLEIGSEELPAGDLSSAIRQLKMLVPRLLEELRLNYERLEVRGTPRRLAVIAHKLAGRQTDIESEVQGPPADRAFDPAGEPTKAAVGFARSKGVTISDLKIVGEGDRRYVAAVVRDAGRPSADVLAKALPDLLAALKFEKNMRWNASNVAFSRPLRWIVAMHGPEAIPFDFAGINSGTKSRGLRINGSPEIEIDDAANYAHIMAENCVVIQSEERKAVILTAAGNLAGEVGGAIREDQKLLGEVANLIEQPTPLRGGYEERFLELPMEVLAAVMTKHQRYFPVYSLDGESLLPYFITVRNGDAQHLNIVRQGNEHVIGARFADAEFFYRRDSRQRLADFLPRLDTLTFQSDLGSMLDKVKRLEELVPAVSEMLELSPEEKMAATTAARLSKADLATSMVVEMTSLQGVIGGHYARLSGEPEVVAAAVAEQYEAVSRTRPGLALALSDRLDSLAGLFAVGLAPTGSNDPFALRRAAIQIVENLVANAIDIDLREALSAASSLLPVEAGAETIDAVLAFISSRLETYLQEQGIRTSVVRAVLAEQAHNPHAAYCAATELNEIVNRETWPSLLDAFARSARITRDQPQFELDAAALALPEEQALSAAYDAAAQMLDGSMPSLVTALEELEPVITLFFDNVLVMDEDVQLRQNRLALLQKISTLPQDIADLSQLEGF